LVSDAAMLDLIFALKFVHVLAAAIMFGAWLSLAIMMLLAHRSGNPSVIAVTAQFVVDVEKIIVGPAIAVQPISGFPLAWAIGFSPLNEFWIVLSLGLFAVAVACWIAAFRIETRIRRLSRQLALQAVALPNHYRRIFRTWAAIAAGGLLATAAIFALMIWQLRLD
jgi:uncharacterized membrane protein